MRQRVSKSVRVKERWWQRVRVTDRLRITDRECKRYRVRKTV